MREYGFADKDWFCSYKGEYGSVKTRILAYFMQRKFPRTKKEVLKWDEISIHFEKLIIALLILTEFKKISEKSYF